MQPAKNALAGCIFCISVYILHFSVIGRIIKE